MLIKRLLSCMIVGLLALLTGTSTFGQGLAGMQIFAPADVSSYGNGPQPNEGFFFVFDGLYWTISAPKVVPVGNPNHPRPFEFNSPIPADDDPGHWIIEQHNELYTGAIKSEFTAGNRLEIGRMNGQHGWMVSVFQMREVVHTSIANDGVAMEIADPVFGEFSHGLLDGNVGGTNPDPPPSFLIRPLPLTFNTILIQNKDNTGGIEVDYIHRSNQLHHGGFFEWYIGPRYIEFDESFLAQADGGILDQSIWFTTAQNHIIAGQIGARAFNKRGRWMLNAEGRFLAGLNLQNIHQTGFIGSNLPADHELVGFPLQMTTQHISHDEFIREFTPGVELRLEARYQVTRSISFRAGWTALWLDHLARPSGMIDYTLPDFGILRDKNNQNVLMQGVTIGIDVNR